MTAYVSDLIAQLSAHRAALAPLSDEHVRVSRALLALDGRGQSKADLVGALLADCPGQPASAIARAADVSDAYVYQLRRQTA